jgi:hypothetical protein
VITIRKQKEDKAKEGQAKNEEKNLDDAESTQKSKQKDMESESA